MFYLSRRLMRRFPLSKTVYLPPEAIRLAFFRHVNLGWGAPSGRHLGKKRNSNLSFHRTQLVSSFPSLPECDIARLCRVGVLFQRELVEGGGEGENAQLPRAVAGVELVVGPAL